MGKKKKQYTGQHARAGTTAELPSIECWENQYARGYEVEISTPEFSSVCPKTGLPDNGNITIYYTPDKTCLELKSLKMYFLAFRDVGIFQENAVNRILDDIVDACQPVSAMVVGEFAPRGGLYSKVTASWSRERAKKQAS